MISRGKKAYLGPALSALMMRRAATQTNKGLSRIMLIMGVILMTTTIRAPITANPSVIIAAGGLRQVALESDQAPGEIGGAYSKIDSAAVDDAGDVIFIARLSNSVVSSAILLKSGDATRVLIRAGDQAPQGGRYKKFLELDRSFYGYNGVNIAFSIFRAELESGSAREGIFLVSPDAVQTIALAGRRSPRGFTYKSFSQPTIVTEKGNQGVGAFVSFVAMMEEGKKSIIMKPSLSGLEEILTTGDKLGTKEVNDFIISQAGAEAVSSVADICDTDSGKCFKEVILVALGNIISGSNLKSKGHVESFGRIKRILTPPAIGFQVSVASVTFKSGLNALAARDVLAEAQVFAKAGDPAPGLPNETIQSFDSPISNTQFPYPADVQKPPFGIVSTIRLSGGRSALWLWLLKFQDPHIPDTKLLLIEGDNPSGGQDSGLHGFIPIKLTNRGTVLLRATAGEGSKAHDGLFVVDGVFEQ